MVPPAVQTRPALAPRSEPRAVRVRTPSVRRPRSATIVAGLGLLTLVALALRLRGIDFLLPHMTQLDASVLVRQVELLRTHAEHPELDGAFAWYPLLLAQLVALWPASVLAGNTLSDHLALASAPWVELRVAAALLSVLAIPATWLIARRFLGAPWAWFAASALAVSLLHASFSSQERPHGPAAAFIAITIACALWLRRSPRPLAYLCTVMACALSLGTLHDGVCALFAFVAAHLLRDRSREPRGARASWTWFVASLLVVLAALPLCYPFHFSGRQSSLAFEQGASETTFNLSGHELMLERFNGRGLRTIAATLWSYDPALTLLALFGTAMIVFRAARGGLVLASDRRRDLAVVLAHALPFAVVLGLYEFTYERFLLPLLPYIACLAAAGACAIAQSVRTLARPSLAYALAFAPLMLVLAPTLAMGDVREAPDTLECAGSWLSQHAQTDERIVIVPYYDLPVFESEAARAENGRRPWSSNWLRHQLAHPAADPNEPRFGVLLTPPAEGSAPRPLVDDPLGYFQDQRADYVVLALACDASEIVLRAREALAGRAPLVARFSPQGKSSDTIESIAFRADDAHPWNSVALQLMSAERMGPTVEIYSLRPQQLSRR